MKMTNPESFPGGNASNGCWYISLLTTNVNLMVVIQVSLDYHYLCHYNAGYIIWEP